MSDRPLILEAISARTSWLQARHTVLAQNVANADTPGYRPRDLAAVSFHDLISSAVTQPRTGLERTHAQHIEATPTASTSAVARKVSGLEASPTGNEVILEEQAQKLAETELDYQFATGLYGKFTGLVRAALSSGGGV